MYQIFPKLLGADFQYALQWILRSNILCSILDMFPYLKKKKKDLISKICLVFNEYFHNL